MKYCSIARKYFSVSRYTTAIFHCHMYCLCTICVTKYCVVFCSVPGPMSKWNVDALVALKGELKLNVKMIALANILETPAGGFMNSAEAQSVRDKSGDAQQIEEVIDILRGKGDKEFATFCQMLRQSNYQVWAHELEVKAEKFKMSDGMKRLLLAFLLLFAAVASSLKFV